MLLLAPLFLSSNMIFGRAVLDIEPFTLAFLRWFFASAILLTLSRNQWPVMLQTFYRHWPMLMFCGFLAFWVCGGIVYLGLHYTTATNGILIYTTPPLIILGLEAFYRGRAIKFRELFGIAIAIIGVLTIIFRGELANVRELQFNPGDLMFVAAAVSWAIYSVLLKSKSVSHMDTLPLLTLVSACGTLTLFPFAAYETATTLSFPYTSYHWAIIAGLVVIASLFAFMSFQYGLRILGASIAGIFMYLLAPYGLLLAWFFLGETMEDFHIYGTCLILGGVILATLPVKLLSGKSRTDTP